MVDKARLFNIYVKNRTAFDKSRNRCFKSITADTHVKSNIISWEGLVMPEIKKYLTTDLRATYTVRVLFATAFDIY